MTINDVKQMTINDLLTWNLKPETWNNFYARFLIRQYI